MCFEVYLGLLIDFVANDFMHLETVCGISSDLYGMCGRLHLAKNILGQFLLF